MGKKGTCTTCEHGNKALRQEPCDSCWKASLRGDKFTRFEKEIKKKLDTSFDV